MKLLANACVCLLLFAAGCGRSANPEGKAEQETSAARGMIRLTAEQVQSLGIRTEPAAQPGNTDFVVVQGRVVPPSGRRASVTAPFAGRLAAPPGGLPIVGRTVRRGELLGTVEQAFSATETLQVNERRIALEAEIERARREADQRARDLERARKLYDGGVIPQKQLQQAELDYHLAESRQQEAEKAQAAYDRIEKQAANPRRIELRAPVGGTVLEANASPGQQVEPGRPIFEIADLNTVWVEAEVFEEYLSRAGAARVEVVALSAPDTVFTGRRVASTHRVDPATRTEGVLYAVDNRAGRLALEMLVDVRLPGAAASRPAAVAQVPVAAVVREGDGAAVFIEKEPHVYERRTIEAGAAQGGQVPVLKGLSPGEPVVVAGVAALRSYGALGPGG